MESRHHTAIVYQLAGERWSGPEDAVHGGRCEPVWCGGGIERDCVEIRQCPTLRYKDG